MDLSLKEELEAETIYERSSRKRLIVFTAILIGLVGAVGSALFLSSADQQIKTQEMSNEPNQPQSREDASESIKDNVETQAVNPSPTPSVPPPSSAPQSYSPQPQSINKATYLADASKVLANYNEIVGLVTFSSSMSDSEKVSRIKQAATLDRQYFGKTTNLRGQLVMANVSNGPYMEATKLAESGVSKISVGLTFMGYWADNQSRTSDLQTGLGGVSEGSEMLLQLSQKLEAL